MQDFYCIFCADETTHIIKVTIEDAEIWVCEECYKNGVYTGLIR